MVHRREIAGREIVFGNQGDLYDGALTLWDHDTGSVWSQPTGTAILGPRTGESLELLLSSLATWADWRTAHPNTTALAVESKPRGNRLDDKAVIIRVGADSAAVPVTDVRRLGSLDATVGGLAVTISISKDSDLVEVRSGVAGSSDPTERVPVFTAFVDDYARIFPSGRVFVDSSFVDIADL